MIATRVSFFLLIVSLCHAGDTQVRYVHLAFTADPSHMNVGWFTQDPTATSTVKWGLGPHNLSEVSTGSANNWKSGYGFNHFTILSGLKPSQQYYYVCGDEQGGWGNIHSFTTQPDEARPFTIGVYGDMGVYYSDDTIDRVTKRVQSNEFDWIFHAGDISYADIHILSFQETWNTWFERMENVTSKVPYMVGPGNHEYVSYNPFLYLATRNFVPYNHRFSMPHANEESLSMYYSFNYGNVHWISYSTETSFPDAPYGEANNFGDQLKWLKADLEKANLPENRKKQPWIIASGHRPIYSSSYGYSKGGVPINSFIPPSNSLTLQKTFEDLFMKYQVDVIFNGHVHSYERNYPAYRNKKVSEYVNPKAPVSIVVGCAGNIEGLEGPDERNWDQPQPEWSAFRFGKGYGYGSLTVSNATHLHWKFYQASNDSLTDEFVVTKMPMYN